MQKTALSVQSLACHGKCSLSEALPLISSLGISLSVLPTILLSTHTGGFGKPQKLETTDFLTNAIEHFKKENLCFDGIYTGYFGDLEQIVNFTNEIDAIKAEKSLVLVDPVLGDNGKLFSGITNDFAKEMLNLCKKADIITPNLTEAFLLCGEEYDEDANTDKIISLAVKLYNITKAKVIITGIERGKKIGALVFDSENCCEIYSKKISQNFHGTGDIFASLVFGLILKGVPIKKAVKKASAFIGKAIKKTINDNIPERNGLNFEKLLKRGL